MRIWSRIVGSRYVLLFMRVRSWILFQVRSWIISYEGQEPNFMRIRSRIIILLIIIFILIMLGSWVRATWGLGAEFLFLINNNFIILARLCWAAASQKPQWTTATRWGFLKIIWIFFTLLLRPVRIFYFRYLIFLKGLVLLFYRIGFLIF